eukprot:gene17819-28683_t
MAKVAEKKSSKRVGGWELTDTLGVGSFGEVRLARNAESGDFAACKVVAKAQLSEGSGREMLQREIATQKALRHPHVLRLLDVLETAAHFYLIIELATGGELLDHIEEQGGFDDDTARAGYETDVWSIGVILYVMLVGDVPWVGEAWGADDGLQGVVVAICQGKYTVPPHVPKGAAELIKGMMTVRPEDRWTLDDVCAHPWFHSPAIRMIRGCCWFREGLSADALSDISSASELGSMECEPCSPPVSPG